MGKARTGLIKKTASLMQKESLCMTGKNYTAIAADNAAHGDLHEGHVGGGRASMSMNRYKVWQ